MARRKEKKKAKTKDDNQDNLSHKSANCDIINYEDDVDVDDGDDGDKVDERQSQRGLAQTVVSQKVGETGVETKLVKNLQAKKCAPAQHHLDAFGRELKHKLEQVSASERAPLPSSRAPLISISIAPPTGQCSRTASCASSTNSTWSLRSATTKRQEHVDEDADDDGQPPRQQETAPSEPLEPPEGLPGRGKEANNEMRKTESCNSDASSACDVFDADSETSRGGRRRLSAADNGDDDDDDEPTSSGLELVRKSYIRLIKYNSLQYFYLGSLIYSVMIMTYLLVSSLLLSVGEPKIFPLGNANNNAAAADNNDTWTRSSSTGSKCDNMNDDDDDSHHQEASRGMMMARWCGLSVMFSATILLLLIIALKFYVDFNQKPKQLQQQQNAKQATRALTSTRENNLSGAAQQQEQDNNNSSNSNNNKSSDKLLESVSPQCLKVLAISLSLLLLVFPIGFYYYKQQSAVLAPAHCQVAGQINSEQANLTPPPPPPPAPPVILLSLIVYILPHLISEITSVKCLQITISILPLALVLLLARDVLSSSNLLVLAIVSLAGQLKHKLLMNLIRRATFKGASELIEAKVSLEQQRQQQETLLLSVLPAYVAEQVKRNMVKKMESFRDDEESCLAGAGAGAGVSNQGGDNQGVQVHLLSTTNVSTQTVHGPAHCGRSLTLPTTPADPVPTTPTEPATSPAGKVLLVAAAAAATVQNQRNSFARTSRLSSSLASGAAYISESLLNNGISGGGGVSGGGSATGLSKTSASVQTQLSACASIGQSMTQLQQNYTCLPAANSSLNMQQQQHQSRRGFNELYIRTYNNVSLLYGDIVGFTRLCTQLSSSQLVRVLNNLFSHFDHLAEQHKIMRIKILGDCYYGVAGIPEFAVTGAKKSSGGGALPKSDNHAISCVNMGLDMIQYIKRVNISRATAASSGGGGGGGRSTARVSSGSVKAQLPAGNGGAQVTGEQQQEEEAPSSASPAQQLPANFELNMRIGIHTGHIHSGVIGLKKWQFDVWSNDVSIAMHCESSGVAGRVQVTEATVQHLRGAFALEPATRSSRDTFLADKEIRTYLIKERVSQLARGAHLAGARNLQSRETQGMDEERIREATIGIIRQTLLSSSGGGGGGGGGVSDCSSDCELAHANAMSGPLSGACGLASQLDHNDIRWLSLTFRDPTLNRHFEEHSVCSTARHLLELLVLFFLLGLALHLVDYLALMYWQQQKQQQLPNYYLRAVLISASLVALSLLLAALPKPALLTSAFTHHQSPTNLQQQQQPQQQSSQKASSLMLSVGRRNSRLSTSWSLANDDLEVDTFAASSPKRSAAARFAKLLAQLPLKGNRHRSLRHKARLTRQRRPNNKWLTSSLIFLTLVLAILGQVYLIGNLMCRAAGDTPQVFPWRVHELQQVAVLIILIALDLSPSLLSYQTRSCFLFAILLLEIFILLLATCTSAGGPSYSSWSRLFENYAGGRLVKGIFCNVQPEQHPVITSASGNNNHNQSDTQDSAMPIINWSSDALLLLATLWSLAFQRQLETAQRCNFLWRNRLNVDHEELEYISGINKVLLENILPSHVVQHYLTQPSGTTSNNCQQQQQQQKQIKATSEEIGKLQQQQRQQDGSTKKVKDSSEAPTIKRSGSGSFRSHKNASISSAQLVRMSVSAQMRGALSSTGTHSAAAATAVVANELYHEQHDSVAVMFASIPHFYEFYDESDISKQGLGCIALLNEIICDFDKLLLKNKFSRIEKIKTIGSTYMAAAGLRPSGPMSFTGNASPAGRQLLTTTSGQCQQLSARNSTASQVSALMATTGSGGDPTAAAAAAAAGGRKNHALSQQKMNLICMIQFATSLMSALNGINKQSFQVFKLRVGVNAGPVIAGIIGAQRPFYDIWGDCVNIASRMESLGEVGRIQVEERTAKLLMECLCNENYSIKRRGPIDVKGKGGMVTYFVDRKEQHQHQHQQQQPQQQDAKQTVCPPDRQQQQVADEPNESSRRQSRDIASASSSSAAATAAQCEIHQQEQ